MAKRFPGQAREDQRRSTFLKNHANAVLACDFFIAVTAGFRMLYVLVVIEHGTRRLRHLDESIEALSLELLRSPVASPKANAICELVNGTIRRECLDWMIPLSEGHLRAILKSWVAHYNQGRPHSLLGHGVPGPPREAAEIPKSESRHRLAASVLVRVESVLGGLHHEYSLATAA